MIETSRGQIRSKTAFPFGAMSQKRGAMPPKKDAEKTPVTIVTGFLGAGKTTLINYILTQRHGMKICVIENEFGAVSVDDKLGIAEKLDSKDDLIMLDNGCACCQVRGDLMDTFQKLAEQDKKFPKGDASEWVVGSM